MPEEPKQAEIDEINKAIEDALADEKDKDLKGAARNFQKAIGLADRYYKIGGNTSGEPKYDPKVKGQAESDAVNGRIKVRLGKAAFVDEKGKPSAAWLASTKIHEILGHGAQIKPGNGFNLNIS